MPIQDGGPHWCIAIYDSSLVPCVSGPGYICPTYGDISNQNLITYGDITYYMCYCDMNVGYSGIYILKLYFLSLIYIHMYYIYTYMPADS